MAKMAHFNPYLSRANKSIVYNVTKTQDGWNIAVVVPDSVPASDRIKVLEWLRAYKAQVKAANPLWSTVLHPSISRYVLEIRTANSDRELIATGEQLKSLCGEMLEYA